MTDFAYLGIAEAAELLRDRKISPLEYTKALIGRIEKYDRELHSFVQFTPELALEDARRAESEIMHGSWRGPLHGVPYGLKDNVDYAGVPTTAQSRILRDNVVSSDAGVTQKLRASGGVFMGKLSLHEFATGGPAVDGPWPPARNPWNREHSCGGSSSGSGVAVAAGFLPAAIGTDTGGSVRNPASMCGIVGMKPTYGVVSRRGVFPLAFSLDHVGPMTRTVRDNALMLDAIAGHDPLDPASAPQLPGGYAKELGRDVKGLRIGVIRHFYSSDIEADPEMSAGIDAAVQKLVDLGAQIREIKMAPLREYGAIYRTIMTSEAYAVHENWMRDRPQDYAAGTRERIMAGALVRAPDYVNATRLRRKLADAFHALFTGIDVAITANSMDPACRIDDSQALENASTRQARSVFNVTGSPALSVPVGYSQLDLPLAMQIISKPFSEALIYRVAHAYEEIANTGRRPPFPK